MSRTMKINRGCAALVLAVAAVAMSAPGAGAAGITTHRWMAETAIDQVTSAELATLLHDNLVMVQTGAGFPDVGYTAGNTYGETAHWQRFVDHLIDAIRARADCGSLTDPAGPCAPLIAFTFGIAAHGMGDEVFDWLFEPNGPDRDEYWTGVPTATDTGAETQMDLVAIGRYGVERPEAGTVPDEALVLQAFVDSGQGGVTSSQFGLVGMLPMLWDVEKGWADEHLADVEAAMPWMSANLVTAPGGVDFAATAIAGYWDSEWGRLLGDQPETRVSITYPAPGETGVPATGWDRDSFQPGTAPGRGGARNRVAAVLTSARPYTGASGGIAVSNELPVGSMTITDVATGDPVPLKSGYPKSVPYGSDGGEHMIDTQPAGNLAMCTWYRVDVSGQVPVMDARGLPVAHYSWQFQTECAPTDTTTTTTTTTSTSTTTTVPATTTTMPETGTTTTMVPATSVPQTSVPGSTMPTTTLPTTTVPETSAPPTSSPTAPSTTNRPATTAATNVDAGNVGSQGMTRPTPHASAARPVVARPAYTG